MLTRASFMGGASTLVLGVGLLTACSSQPAAQTESESPSVLFSVTSDAVHFENPSGMDVTMVMDGVDPESIWFTDRPARESGVITTTKLANEWVKGGTFDVDPPNAALVLHEPTNADAAMADTLVATVQHATYDAAARTLTTSLHVLTDEEARALEGNLDKHGMSHDRAFPAKAGAASLFIDSVSLAAVSSSPTPSPSAHTTPAASPKSSVTPTASTSSSPIVAQHLHCRPSDGTCGVTTSTPSISMPSPPTASSTFDATTIYFTYCDPTRPDDRETCGSSPADPANEPSIPQ